MKEDEIIKMVARCNAEIERLEEENQTLEEKISELEDRSEDDWRWARHFEVEEADLPVPRLEIRYKDLGNWYNYECIYGLVYKHLLGHCYFIPLGGTRIGGQGEKPMYNGKPRLPYRDGAHVNSDMVHFGIPAYSMLEGRYYEINHGER